MANLGLYKPNLDKISEDKPQKTETQPTFPVIDPGIQALADKKGWTYDRAKAALIKAGKIKE